MRSRKDGKARILAVGEAFPPHYYRQADLLQALKALWHSQDLDFRKLERFHAHTSVEGRHLALPIERYGRLESWGEANDLWIEAAGNLGEEATRKALQGAGLGPADVDILLFVSVTGLATPSIDARLVDRLGLPPSVRRLPIFGLGCVAGASGLACGSELLAGRPGKVAVLLSVELCSLTFRVDDVSVPNQVATGLFGDGAAAVVLVSEDRHGKGPRILGSRSTLYPRTEDAMGWVISERGFRLVLSAQLPELVREKLPGEVDRFLSGFGLHRRDIRRWIAHSGGPRILRAVQESLELEPQDLESAWNLMRRKGNTSSSSVLLALQETMNGHSPEPGSYGLLFAMGPGFCTELLLLQW